MSEHAKVSPPKWPLKILQFFIKKEYLEEIEGDMEELFNTHVENYSIRSAHRMYIWETLKLLRPILLKNIKQPHFVNQTPMFRNYFKTSIRSLFKNPLSSFINVFGLAVAIGICLLVYTFMEYDKSIDQFHKNKNEVYLVTFFANREGTTQQYGLSPRPLAELLKQDFAQVKRVCRVEDRNAVIKYADNVFHENIRYTDESFLEMFTFPMKWGKASTLGDLNSIVLSEDMSTKYFGEENAIGKDVTVIFSDSNKKTFTVTGVAAAFPKAHDIDFNFLINFKNIQIAESDYTQSDWKEFSNGALIQVENPNDVKLIGQGLEKYKIIQNQAQPDWSIASFSFEPIATIHDHAANIKNAIAHDYNVEGRIGMPIIAIFMIVLACFNYINIAIVSAAKRLKEIGVRKVIGANRTKVIIQFLTENVVITFFALVVGIAFCFFIFLPWFVEFTGWPLELRLVNQNLWIFILSLVLFTGIVSGIYPAFYISKFEAIKIFKGSLQFGRKNPLTKVFLGVQLVLACITITAGVVFMQNKSYQNTRSWGYNQKDLLYVNVPDKAAYDKLNAAMTLNKNVVMLSGAETHVGNDNATSILHTTGNHQYEVSHFSVADNYFETMGIQLIDGETFKKGDKAVTNKLVINELFARNLNLVQPLGHTFIIDSVRYTVVGMVKDFHARDFFSKVQPTVFTLANEADYHYLAMRVANGTERQTYNDLQKHWSRLYPEIPFQGGYQEDAMKNYFYSVDRSESFNMVIASIAVLLACLGLYGLVTLNVSGRTREFSIRKTLGANGNSIAWVIIKQYVVLTAIALVVGAPISYVFTNAYLDMLFAYHIPMGLSGTAFALIILVMVLLTVLATQISKVLRSNPVDGLKTE